MSASAWLFVGLTLACECCLQLKGCGEFIPFLLAGPPATDNVSFKAGSVTDLAAAFGERKFASALDSALYHCLDDDTKIKYLAALHGQVRLACCAPTVLDSPCTFVNTHVGHMLCTCSCLREEEKNCL